MSPPIAPFTFWSVCVDTPTGAEARRSEGNVPVRITMHHTTFLLATAAAAIAIATAPSASAAPNEQHCSDAGGSTNCQRPGNAQVHTSPRALPRGFPPPSTRGGVIAATARGSRSTGLTRSGRPLAITRCTAGFSLDPLCCVDNLSLRLFDAPRGRRLHVHPRFLMALTLVTRPCTRSRATRRSPLRSG